jgi:hypothetical protein
MTDSALSLYVYFFFDKNLMGLFKNHKSLVGKYQITPHNEYKYLTELLMLI